MKPNLDITINNEKEARKFLVELFHTGNTFHEVGDTIIFMEGDELLTAQEYAQLKNLVDDCYTHLDDPTGVFRNQIVNQN
jgi:hypothetical protein